ncbi:hypothetical protein LB504_002491 [Fusarium proliferatum]|nr:hypothetical protein LB504_002491 [Fusarium proliferatum]
MAMHLLGHLLVEDGRDGLARTAPCSEAVDKNSLRIEQPCYGMAGQRKPQRLSEQPERQVA